MKQISTLFLAVLATASLFAQNYNVTFKVDMTGYTGTITTGAFVNGTWNGWCGNCNPLTDADNDGVWEVTLPIPAGEHEFKFTVDGWNDQEMFSQGDPCTLTDPSGQFTNRALIVNHDMTYGVVPFNDCKGAAGHPDSTYVMVYLNTANTTPADTTYITGGAGWGSPGQYPLVDPDGNGIYTGVFKKAVGFSSHYTFVNAYCPDYSCKENIAGQPCADPGNFNDRTPNAPLLNDTIIRTCYGECSPTTACTPLAPPVRVVFQVDMTEYAATKSFGFVNVSGTLNGWCGDCAKLNDDDADNIWSDTLELQAGTYEFKFSIDNWADQENFDPATDDSLCTLTTGGFTNRILTVTADTTLPAVCLASCFACQPVGIEPTVAAIQVYPSPAKDQVTVYMPAAQPGMTIELMDVMGRVLESDQLSTNGVHTFGLSQATNGVYFIRIADGRNQFTQRFIVVK